jgi:hypothetical protein
MKIQRLFELFGTKVALAEFLGVSRAAANNWRLTEELPKLRAFELREKLRIAYQEIDAELSKDSSRPE